MRRFVDKVKTGNWTKTLAAVANFGAAATSVGVFAGIKAAEPLAKDIARGLKDAAGAGMQAITQVRLVVSPRLVNPFPSFPSFPGVGLVNQFQLGTIREYPSSLSQAVSA